MVLSVVYPPRGSDIESAIDIVAVHGLGGDAIDTWTHSKSNAFWLKDFLPQQIPDARILTFGYNAAAAFGQSTSQVIDHAKSLLASLVDKREEEEEQQRPLLFVAHSLGDIVVKEALLQARLESRYKPIRDTTIGIMFFGTPHRGSDKAVYGKVLSNIAQTVLHRPKSSLIAALQTNSDVLLRLTTDFRHQLPQYQVYSFYEQRPMWPSSSLIVEKSSALLEAAHEEQLPVDADHSAMCKFEKEDDDTFEKVYKRIQRARKIAKSSEKEGNAICNDHFEVPRLLSPSFTEREDVCRLLDDSLALAPEPRQAVQRRFVLFGLGGAGKTQICLRYAQKHRERYWGVFWIDASSETSIQRSIIQIALVLQLSQDETSVENALANAKKPWLLIFDNADDPTLPLYSYFPSGNRGDIIITSRNPATSQYQTVGSENLGSMVPGDARELLLRTAFGRTDADNNMYQAAGEVVHALGYLALAVAHAGAYIRETTCHIQDYLRIYQRYQSMVLKYQPQHIGTDYDLTVYTTWQVSLDKIESAGDDISKCALNLLKLISFYHHDQIPLKMFYQAWQRSRKRKETLLCCPWLETTNELLELKELLNTQVSRLVSFSLVTRNMNDTLSLHPLIHGWCQSRLSDHEKQSGRRHAVSLLAESVSRGNMAEELSYRRSVVLHAQSCFLPESRRGKVEDHRNASEWVAMAQLFFENNLAQDAVTLLEKVVKSTRHDLGDDNLTIIGSMRLLSIAYTELEMFEKAVRLNEDVKNGQAQVHGDDYSHTLNDRSLLAWSYSQSGKQDEALRELEQVLGLQRDNSSNTPVDILSTYNRLAWHYDQAGRMEDSMKLMTETLALGVEKLGDRHPWTLSMMHNLALLYCGSKETGEALQVQKKLVLLRKSEYGDDHPETLEAIERLRFYEQEYEGEHVNTTGANR